MPFAMGCVFMAFGLLVAVLGIVLWKKQAISFASSYRYVKPKDKKAFTKEVGFSTIGIGISIFGLGLLMALKLLFIAFIVFAAFFVVSLVLYFDAQGKYNK